MSQSRDEITYKSHARDWWERPRSKGRATPREATSKPSAACAALLRKPLENTINLTMNHALPLVRYAALVAVAASLAGCPSPNVYGTARTLPAGQMQHTAAIEFIGVKPSTGEGLFLPTAPTYQLRLGVTDRVDMGFRLGNLSTLGFDTKINLVRGAFDLAIDPGLQGMYLAVGSSGGGLVYFNLPVILGFNLSQSFSIIATPGIAYALGFGYSSTSSEYNSDGFAARLGLGANIRVSRSFALQPEVTALYFPASEGVIFSAGFGFSFGGQPDYSDIQ